MPALVSSNVRRGVILLVTESVLDRSNFAPQLAQCIESSLMLAPQTVHCFIAVEVVIETNFVRSVGEALGSIDIYTNNVYVSSTFRNRLSARFALQSKGNLLSQEKKLDATPSPT